MATSGADRKLKLWDLRSLKELSSCRLKAGASHMSFSQKTLVACAVDRHVEVSCMFDGVLSRGLFDAHVLNSAKRMH